MNQLSDLMNCLRPEPTGFSDQEQPEVHECSYCIERATRSVEYRDNGQRKHVFTCDECHVIEDWTGKEIILITKL